MSLERVMVVSHGHPELSRGGAEMVAGHLARGLRDRGVRTLLLARAPRTEQTRSTFSMRNEGRDVLFHTEMSDHFLFRSEAAEHVTHDFAGLLGRFRPQVIHFQHFVHLGIETIRQARLSCPDARILLTLHEFLPICAHQGQMVRRDTMALCERSSPADCARCFPEHSRADFFLRRRYLQSVLEDVDLFIAPSRFLKQRYVDWGLDAERIEVLENGQPEAQRAPPRALIENEPRGRFGYFGQLNPFKGVDLLLSAAAQLQPELGSAFHVDVHGANLELQEPAFREEIEGLAEAAKDAVTMHGPYDPADLGRLMAAVDWVVVPSIWWENSPMVIQEAYAHGRPVIAADIGGMREKVGPGGGGLRFTARDATSLAETMRQALDHAVFENALATLPSPLGIEPWIDAHLRAYGIA